MEQTGRPLMNLTASREEYLMRKEGKLRESHQSDPALPEEDEGGYNWEEWN